MDARMATEWSYGDLQSIRKIRPWFNAAIWNVISTIIQHLNPNLQACGNLEAVR
jgi:hypothetical protein